MSRFVFIVTTDGDIQYRPEESFDITQGDEERFYTITAAKAWLKAQWEKEATQLRTSIQGLKKVRRTDVVREGMRRSRK